MSNADNRSKSVYDNNSAPIFVTPRSDGTTDVKITGQGAVYFFPGPMDARS